MKNPDGSLVGADPIHFSEFVDENGLVCFQYHSYSRFQKIPPQTILRVSPEVWLGIHDDSVPANDQLLNNQSADDQPLTADEQIVEHMKILVDQRLQRTPKSALKLEPVPLADYDQIVSEALERQIWDLRLERVVFGDVMQRRDREIKIGSLFVKRETKRLQMRISWHPRGQWVGNYFIPMEGL